MSIKNKFPNIKPSLNLDFANTKQLDSRITFTRASTATYWDGVTQAKAEENLLRYSQDFDNAYWSKTGASVAANTTTATDGAATADTITGTAGGYSQYIALLTPTNTGFSAASTVTNTFSVYLKAGTVSSVRVYAYNTVGGSNIYGTFDLTAVSAVAGGTAMTPTVSIVDVGGGWRRCVVTGHLGGSAGQIGNLVIYADNGAFHAWGAQLEQRSQVTDYTPTTGQPITKYQPVLRTAASGAARFDHNPVTGESLGLLIEEQRTNLFLQSQQFDDAAWSKINASIAPDVFVAPDGTLSADKIVSASGQVGYVFRGVTTTSGAAYTVSVFAKKGEHRYIQVNGDASSGRIAANAFFDLEAGVVSANAAGSASISHAGNGWYRCSVSGVASSTSAQPFFRSSTSGTVATNSDGYSGAYIWGAQLEAGSFPTSYIPTTSAQVTRAADAAVMTGTNFSSWYRQDEGSLYGSGAVLTANQPGQRFLAYAYSAANNNGIGTGFNAATFAGTVVDGSAQVNIVGGSYSANTENKTAFAYKVNDFALAVNAVNVGTDISGSIPAVDSLAVGRYTPAGNIINGTIKRLAYYPKRLSNAELQALTA